MRDMNLIIKGNIRKNKGAYITVFILMFIVSICFVAVISVVSNTNRHNRQAMDKTGLGDMLVWCSGHNISGDLDDAKVEFENRLKSSPAISEVKVIEQITTIISDINGKSYGKSLFMMDYRSEEVSFDIYDGDDNLVENPVLNKGEIIVPISFKLLFDADIGDSITVGYEDNTMDFTIAYFFEDPYMGTAMMGIKTLLISEEDIAYIKEVYNEAYDAFAESVLFSLKKSDADMGDMEFEKQVNNDTNVSAYSWISITKNQSYKYMLMMVNIFSGILTGFIILLVIIAIIVLGHNISNSIEKDYVNYGIYKAVGITNNKLKMSIMCGYIFTCLMGFICGIPVAVPIIRIINRIIRPLNGTYVEDNANIAGSVIVMLLILIVVSLYILVKVTGISRVTPVMALNEGRADVHFSSVFKLPVSKKLLNTSLAYRQLISRKKQYASAIIITALLVVFMILINQTLTWLGDGDGKSLDLLFTPFESDIYVAVDEDEMPDKVKEIDELIAGESDYDKYHLWSKYILLNDMTIYCYFVDKPEEVINIYKGRTCLYDNEVLITEYLSEELGIDIGDTVTVGDYDDKEEYIVSGFITSGNDTGKCFVMSCAGYDRLRKSSDWTWKIAYYKIEDDSKIDGIIDLINERYGEYNISAAKAELGIADDTIVVAIEGISVVIYVLSAIFIIITVLLVSSKMFEREKKDYGILKSCGFEVGDLRSQFALRFMLASIVGSLLGMVLALIFGERIMSLIFSMFGVMHLDFSFGISALIIPICVMALMFYAFAYLVSRRIKKVSTRVLVVE
ncbi:MAG: ABC transporter permease [Lachnospiraceae bacterium]|nr:ABC transporter permease [Lachnospiraceae bacterium]